MSRYKHLLTVKFVLGCSIALAHGGALDSDGGHHNRKIGGYHFHQGPYAGNTGTTKAEAMGKGETSTFEYFFMVAVGVSGLVWFGSKFKNK